MEIAMKRFSLMAAGSIACSLVASPALAASRTFVSGAGSDSGDCSLAAPCPTFAYALTQTAESGEITVLTSAGYGPVTITKSVSIINQMRALLVLCISALAIVPAIAQTCDKQEAAARIEQELGEFRKVIPIGRRFVIDDGGGHGDETYGSEQINRSAYIELGKIAAAGLVNIVQLPHTPENGWNESDALSKRIVGVINIQSSGITSEPTYKVISPSWISVALVKSLTKFVVVDAIAFHSVTETYCLLSYVYHVDYTPSLAPAFGYSLFEDRKKRSLEKYDAFRSGWVFITSDGAFLNDDFKTNNVENAVARLNLTR
jgi:hypothetical protein